MLVFKSQYSRAEMECDTVRRGAVVAPQHWGPAGRWLLGEQPGKLCQKQDKLSKHHLQLSWADYTQTSTQDTQNSLLLVN